ncbi:alpha/beta fold hydrolase [Atlantibacter subterraneus]|jgi:non-heme chloroperoxidase|uniref:Alpha/beta hydrolase n=1 Tax=Atlantibacter subterraneus TaxID=255519 RepID=A0A3R9EHC3_9ENTR|nr:alpha/beta hydrolase [Atlantibacter subterranea]MDZ5666703.1 alpha/beta hydrolase [Atlantibacter hermannii]MDA3134159.1 alpha/beta hydrolase [Atlantibacter subterranea]MDV7022854.1 alpha/beta hydrolase [Atlantibacter subterranea]RSB60780.1 alpha/beta hydrolase [Atlantibacter subterranea]RSE03066.1 alpha/beta hydrolase [Atlantibacter subterranea]
MSDIDKITLSDGSYLYFKDWGSGQPIVFSHGWPLTADAFEDQMLFLGQQGYRVIAHDRRGHGRSSQPWEGHNMDRYADDLAELTAHLDLQDAIHVGHSTGGGEVARYIGRHGTARVAKAVLIGAVTPIMINTDFNPNGVPKSVFDGIRDGVINDRAAFFKELTLAFYGYNRDGAQPSEEVRNSFVRQGMQGSIKALYDCIKAFSETDLREDLRKMTVPTLVIHGDDDQIVPFETCGKVAAEILPDATLKVYEGGSHGICTTHKQQINQDLLEFIGR